MTGLSALPALSLTTPSQGWQPAGAAPQLKWIEVSQLRVDQAYQRPITPRGWNNVSRIATEFRWSKFAPVIVAPAEGGLFAIIDGQHRTLAAKARGIEMIPCQIVAVDAQAQAAAFAAINGAVTPVSATALYKAALAAGVEWAVTLKRVAGEAGVFPQTYPKPKKEMKPGETLCIGTLRQLLDRRGENGLLACLKRVMAHAGAQEPGFVDAHQVRVAAGIHAGAHILTEKAPPATAPITKAIKVNDEDFTFEVKELASRGFSKSMIATRLRRPYADVERVLAA